MLTLKHQATTPVTVLIAGWCLAVEKPNLRTLRNISFIVVGIIIASYGEILFDPTGFMYQVFGNIFEAFRLVLVQRLLSSAEYKMDPLVSLYYFAPVCATLNLLLFLIFESKYLLIADLMRVGSAMFILNALVAFALNVSSVFLVGCLLQRLTYINTNVYQNRLEKPRPWFLHFAAFSRIFSLSAHRFLSLARQYQGSNWQDILSLWRVSCTINLVLISSGKVTLIYVGVALGALGQGK